MKPKHIALASIVLVGLLMLPNLVDLPNTNRSVNSYSSSSDTHLVAIQDGRFVRIEVKPEEPPTDWGSIVFGLIALSAIGFAGYQGWKFFKNESELPSRLPAEETTADKHDV